MTRSASASRIVDRGFAAVLALVIGLAIAFIAGMLFGWYLGVLAVTAVLGAFVIVNGLCSLLLDWRNDTEMTLPQSPRGRA